MPPRYAYWTILIDNRPTAFRARDREELLPTLAQLRRTNTDVVMKWFARGRLWDTPEQAQWAAKNLEQRRSEQRGREWRPGGEHKDPRARFDARRRETRPAAPRAEPAHKAPFTARKTWERTGRDRKSSSHAGEAGKRPERDRYQPRGHRGRSRPPDRNKPPGRNRS